MADYAAMTDYETVFQSGIDVANDVAEDARNAGVLLNDKISEVFDTSCYIFVPLQCSSIIRRSFGARLILI